MLNFERVRLGNLHDKPVVIKAEDVDDLYTIINPLHKDVMWFGVSLTDSHSSYEIAIQEFMQMSDYVAIDGIKIPSHKGTWGTIDFQVYDGKLLMLLEHETYGDEAACIIVDLNGNVILEDVWDGWDDYEDYQVDMEGDGGQW